MATETATLEEEGIKITHEEGLEQVSEDSFKFTLLILTGIYGVGKTQTLLGILEHMKRSGLPCPKVIANDKGKYGDDFIKLEAAIKALWGDDAKTAEEVEVTMLDEDVININGVCIGCEGLSTFLGIIDKMLETRQSLAILEPTGLFDEIQKLEDELAELQERFKQQGNGSVKIDVRRIHLLPGNELFSAALDVAHLDGESLVGVGLTHLRPDYKVKEQLLDPYGVPVSFIPGPESKHMPTVAKKIYNLLTSPKPGHDHAEDSNHNHGHSHGHNHGHEHDHGGHEEPCSEIGCSHEHDHRHSHGHSHEHDCSHFHEECNHDHGHGHEHIHTYLEGDHIENTLSTVGYNRDTLLAQIARIADQIGYNNIYRLKGHVRGTDGTLYHIQIASRGLSIDTVKDEDGNELKVGEDDQRLNIFIATSEPVRFQTEVESANSLIESLMSGVPDVEVIDPYGYDSVSLCPTPVWKIPYQTGLKAEGPERAKCGNLLVERCVRIVELINKETLNLDPLMVDYYRMEALMFWAHIKYVFGLDVESEEIEFMGVNISGLNVNSINFDKLKGWFWDGGPDFEEALTQILPDHSELLTSIVKRAKSLNAKVAV